MSEKDGLQATVILTQRFSHIKFIMISVIDY